MTSLYGGLLSPLILLILLLIARDVTIDQIGLNLLSIALDCLFVNL
jgi:hypothetical protein